MNWQRVSFTLLASSILALAAVIAIPAVQADDKPAEKLADKPADKPAEKIPAPMAPATGAPTMAPATGPVMGSVDAGGCGSPCGSPCGPTYTTVKVTEYVRTQVHEKHTVMKPITTTETYTAYKTECVEEARPHTVTVMTRVPVTVNETRCVHKCVPTVETRCVTKCVPVCKTVTEMCTRTVDKGHWECKEEVCGPTLFEKVRSKLASHSCGGCASDCGCSDPCGSTTSCEPCGHIKTKKVWVACKVTEQYPVTKTIRTHETITENVQVTVNKTITETIVVPVTTWKCVPETKTEIVKVMVPHQVAYQATRCVTKCVPVEEDVVVTKCIPTVVEKQVAVSTGGCGCGCEDACGHKSFSLSGLLGRFHKSCGCE